MKTKQQPGVNQSNNFDSVVVGAGFAGLYMLHRLREMGHRAIAIEKGGGVGGTWYWNRYPGARCDGPSMEYSYQFDSDLQQEWTWSEKYSSQPEILRYANHVADRFGLKPHIRFGCTVVACKYIEQSNQWAVTTCDKDGNQATVNAIYLIAATGCLSSPNRPDIPGLQHFEGSIYHTGEWPHTNIDFGGKQVGVIGTGSSGIQAIPVIAEQAAHLTVFQRTANFAVPARNAPLETSESDQIKANYTALRKQAATTRNGHLTAPNSQSALAVSESERHAQYESRWKNGGLPFLGSFNDLTIDEASNKTAADFVRNKIRETVEDPETARRLIPTTMIGCKRLCVDSGYYEAFNQPNVALVDINDTPIDSVEPSGISVNGKVIELDAIVFATGYDAMTGSLLKLNITGRSSVTLAERWHAGPATYLGLAVHDFPNFFTLTGPGSPSVLTNMLPTIEQHVNLLSTLLKHAQKNNMNNIEATKDAQDDWVAHVNETAEKTIYPGCNSWYLGANVPGKPRVFMPYVGFPEFVRRCEVMITNGFSGFEISG